MDINLEQLGVLLIVGVVAGWLAGLIMKGRGQGLVVNLIVGVVGAFFGSWLFGVIGISVGSGIVAMIFSALVGAVVLLALIKLIK